MKALGWSVLSVVLGLAAGLVVTALAGESPVHILAVLYTSVFGSAYDMGMTLFYATPLLFTGLAVAIPYRAGLFNIGAEGQMTFGVFAAAAVGALFPLVPQPWSWIAAGVAAGLVAGLWGLLAGWLKVKRGSHEVISTIMLNFIATGITSYFALNHLRNGDSQNPETAPIGDTYILAPWSGFDGAPLGSAFAVGVVLCLAFHFWLKRMPSGYELSAVGQNPKAAERAGIQADRVKILALFLGGMFAGLVGVGEVLGNAGRFRVQFSPGYGFIGIAVALLARGQPLAVIPCALLFGALHKGTSNLDFETETVTRDVSMVFQALVILFVASDLGHLFSGFSARFKIRQKAKQEKVRS